MEKRNLFKSFLIIAMILIGLCILPGPGIAADLSADYVILEESGKEITNAKIFIKGDRIRQEMVMEAGRKQIIIIRPDKRVMWMVMPKEHIYMEMPLRENDKKFEKWTLDKEKKAKYLGKETVSGLSCKKYEMTEKGEKTFLWISEKSPFPVKIKHKNGSMVYQNVKQGKVPDSLFEIPSGYKKMSMPMMPGGRGMPK